MAVNDSGFNARVMLWVIGAAILSFVGYLFLSAYAPDLKSGSDGRGHVLSRSAIGYSALVQLQDELGRAPKIIRQKKGLYTEQLVVVMPELGTDPKALETLILERVDRPTLIILPKRVTQPDPLHPGWVFGRTLAEWSQVESLMQAVSKITVKQQRGNGAALRYTSEWTPPITFPVDAVVQTISGPNIVSYISDDDGNILLGGINRPDSDDDYTPIYILSDPDVMNNLGLANPQMAYAASQILAELDTADNDAVEFDATLNGFETSNNLLKLIFEPPFLALSLCLFFAAIMALFAGLMRFGPPLKDVRAVPPGKAALINNSADLLRLAEREYEVGARYGVVTRDLAAQSLGLPQMMSADAATERLDAASKDGPAFSSLADDAATARNSPDMLAAARALFRWRKEKTR
jgi:hypothetical protein